VYYRGPKVFVDVIDGLKRFMEAKQYDSVDAFQGRVLRKIRSYEDMPLEEELEYPSPIVAVVDQQGCNYCGQCATSCIHDAIDFNKKEQLCRVASERCKGCGFCAGLCPANSIRIVTKTDGRTVWAGTGSLKADWVNW
jgi:dihydropyrimidine dehydrogenase (NAD+) subunit PreA